MPGWKGGTHRRRDPRRRCATSATTSAAPTRPPRSSRSGARPRARSTLALEAGTATFETCTTCSPTRRPRDRRDARRRHRRASLTHAVGHRPHATSIVWPLPQEAATLIVTVTDCRRSSPPTCSSSAAVPPAPRPATGSPATATTSPSSSARPSPARRRAATASPREPCTSSSEMGLTEQLSQVPPLPRAARHRHGPRARAAVAAHPKYPQPRLRRAPPRARPDGGRRTPRPAGATLLPGHEALEPIVDRGFVRGATVQTHGRRDARDPRPATSSSPMAPTVASVGRSARSAPASGRTAPPSAPTGSRPGTPTRGSSRALDVKDRNGNPMPGYGWIFPVGDGTVNIGVGLLSTFRDFKSVNTTHLLDAYAHQVAERWEIDPGNPECKADQRPHPDGRLGGPEGRSHLPRRRRRGRQREPVQR